MRCGANGVLGRGGVVAGVVGVLFSVASAEAPRERPNIVVILADDLGYSDLGCYGGEIETPNLDALAKGGVRLTQLYTSARCCPTRASLMTGLYPSQAGIGDFTTGKPHATRGPGYLGRLNDRCVTLAEVLGPAGYACYYVGKWHMHPETGPIARGFDEFYGYTAGHSHDQYDASYYFRAPKGRKKEIDPPQGEYYATDVFNDYAVEFIRQGQETGKPWLVFLGHSSPHFPVQAPADRADKYQALYERGWDVLREERYERMQKLGLVDGEHWTLTSRSLVPVDREDIANGYPGQPNPAWDELDVGRRRDLARRMAVFAAMVESIDVGVGQIVQHLQETDDLENTLILFLSDNGACYEWGPFGFDGPSRRGRTDLYPANRLREIGGPGTHQSYGSGWANLGNTPLRLYKHFTHEGGLSTPFIAHWPRGINASDRWVRDPAHVMDVMPTILDATGADYPAEHDGKPITPLEGTSLLPALRGKQLPQRSIGFDHQKARALREGPWKLVWSKRMPYEIQWELYNLSTDRCETTNVAAQHPERVQAMAAAWEAWARRVQVIYEKPKTPKPPNVVLIVVDDLRFDEFAAGGHPYLETPNIDRLAREGAMFPSAYHACPLCSPNRACILTGQYPSRHGVLDNTSRSHASHRLQLFPRELQRGGYRTAHIGKWHMGNDPTPRPGYDEWVSFAGQGRTKDPELYGNDGVYQVEGYITDIFSERTADFIRRSKDQPFFVCLAHKAVHPEAHQRDDGTVDLDKGREFIPAERHRGRHAGKTVTRRPNYGRAPPDRRNKPVLEQALDHKHTPAIETEFAKIIDHGVAEETIRQRAEMILAVDEGVGLILRTLEELGKLDETMVIFTSDNGYFYGEHGLSIERRLPYEEALRTPLLIRYPKTVKPGTRPPGIALSIDLAPTILELGGIPVPDYVQGRSLLPMLSGEQESVRDVAYMEFYSHENPFPWTVNLDYRVIRKGSYKYIHWLRFEQGELYDLAADPYEQHNLVDRLEHQDRVKEMRGHLKELTLEALGLD